MKRLLSDSKLIEKYDSVMGGTFTLSDLSNLLAESHRNQLYRRIRYLENAGVLKRFSNGIYITNNYSLYTLSQRLSEESYISFGNILSDNLIIGVLPRHQVDAVRTGKTGKFTGDEIVVRYFRISKLLYFGYQCKNGINLAIPEKAFLDSLYFHQHGVRFYFNIYSDIDISKLDHTNLKGMLRRYKNPRFIRFVEAFLDENT